MAKFTNEEKYKTVEERVKAYARHEGLNSNQMGVIHAEVVFNWLASEMEDEKPMSCPFCGGECKIMFTVTGNDYFVKCGDNRCSYSSGITAGRAEAIAAHNRVCRAVKAAKEGDEK